MIVIGGGFAGCEAAWQLAKRGIDVTLYEMKPHRYSPAHSMDSLCEVVCSNSFKSDDITTASGLLKAEMRLFDSIVLRAAEETKVPAGGALAVDREKFSKKMTALLEENPHITIVREEIEKLPDAPVIIATGPLTSEALTESLAPILGEKSLSFYDAAAPVVTAESIDMSIAFCAARYGKGEADYINCPMNREQYTAFYEALVSAETASLHEDIDKPQVFEGCMPIEIMARRGERTLSFGPLRPVGLNHPETGERFHAVVQLRRDNTEGTLYNLVGFQTNLKWGEQKRVFSMIPGLENAEFVRYGVMHRNTYINSPKLLTEGLALKSNENIMFAGQITGVEGYMESAACGIMAGYLYGRHLELPPQETMMGALMRYITGDCVGDFQPMNANFGILPSLETRIRNKKERYGVLANRALEKMKVYKDQTED